jgi:adenylate kinase family enzyme
MKRILIVGCSGSGKTVLAKKLGKETGIPVIHLDRLFWRPNWVAPSKQEWLEIINKIVKDESWIIEGNYSAAIDLRIAAADAVIFLNFPRLICFGRVLWRMARHYNATRKDMAAGCKERIDIPFLKYVWNYNKTRLPVLLEKLESLKTNTTKEVFILRNKREVNSFIEAV